MRLGKIAYTVLMGALALGLMLFAGYAAGKQPALLLNHRMLDFRLRCNEARCVRMGVDPYEVWKGRVRIPNYVPWDFHEAIDHHEMVPHRNYVHAYPPWAYSVIMPFTFLDDVFSACFWMALLWGLVIAGTCAAFLIAYRKSHCLWLGFSSIVAVWLFGSSMLGCLFYGNYGIMVACVIAVAIALHGRGLDGWAGVAWTLALVKPQLSLLLVIPLLCLRKWKTLGVMAVLTVGLTLVPCVLCHKSPWTMISSIADYSAGQFFETGFVAQSVFLELIGEGGVPPALLTMGSAAVGAFICGVITISLSRILRTRLQGSEGALACALIFLPALVLSTVWTAARGHDNSIHAVTSVILLCFSMHAGYPKWVRVCAAVLIPVLAISPFETEFGWPVNVVRLTSVVGLVVLTMGLMGKGVERPLPAFRLGGNRLKACADGALSLLLLGVALHGVVSVGTSMDGQPPIVRDQQMIDFHMRRNEACCVREGMDPFLVWRGDIRDARYTPWSFAVAKGEHALVPFRRFVHAYPPWEYAMMLPFTWMDERDAGSCYIALMYLSLAFLSCLAVLFGHRLTGRWWCGCLLLAAAWRFAVPYACCIMYGNFGVVIAALMAAALVFQMRGHDVWAGVFWTLCFVKPQVAVILLVPLAALRKWRTLLTVGSCLTVLTLIPSALCRRSPWDMLVCIREYSANQFNALALIPKSVFLTLTEEGGLSASVLIMSSTVLIGVVCVLLTLMLVIGAPCRRERDVADGWMRPLLVFVPAMLLSTVWTSARLHDLSVQSVTAELAFAAAFAIRDTKTRVVSILLGVCLCCQHMDIFLNWSINPFQSASVALLCAWCWTLARWNKGRDTQRYCADINPGHHNKG